MTTGGRFMDNKDVCNDIIEVNGDPHRIWLGRLPTRITEFAVLQLAKQFGDLSDFHFPVHKTGDLQGSTVGYCFLTYKSVDDATKARKVLDGLNFHGYTLVARPARPTRDELTVAQRASDEASKLRIMEEAMQREAQLVAVMGIYDSTSFSSSLTENPCDRTANEHSFHTSKVSTDSLSNCSSVLLSRVHIPDMYGTLGLNQGSQSHPKSNSHKTTLKTSLHNINQHRPKHQAETKAAIHRIEMALRNLEKTPVGGASSLKPITDGHSPYAGALTTNVKSNRTECSTSSYSGRSVKKAYSNDTIKSRVFLSAYHHRHQCGKPNNQLLVKKYTHKRDFISRPI
ncbi:putative RNA-binding protein [Schistosoma japonicum]|uniref:Putative RNA-binding protein n=1 Tax=Schistosoma japonicum TaxID=6182 RepID=A0A4Z2CQS2_SCHJA|nr:putative RNA-binding protein 18 [Schistosoma japonicum]KAH8857386.1 putative RNA-binding protein 18 [Schistosoma japonicum]KAH8857387.1 putative RNA-binding protein 18 [Schistosoma japonicum]TNN06404.1 putative RNA-binding protein [Schistosoma japonicum]